MMRFMEVACCQEKTHEGCSPKSPMSISICGRQLFARELDDESADGLIQLGKAQTKPFQTKLLNVLIPKPNLQMF